MPLPTQEVRRRHRYLSHLPLTCEFSICELALQPPILSKETLDIFAGEPPLVSSWGVGGLGVALASPPLSVCLRHLLTLNVSCTPSDELEKRRRMRQKKAREEKRRERRIEMEENKKQGKCEQRDGWMGGVRGVLIILA